MIFIQFSLVTTTLLELNVHVVGCAIDLLQYLLYIDDVLFSVHVDYFGHLMTFVVSSSLQPIGTCVPC